MPVPLSGQVTVSATAQPLAPTGTPNPTAWVLKCPRGNTQNVYIGPPGVLNTTGAIMEPGDDFDFEQRNKAGELIYQLRPSDVYVVGNPGDRVSWFGSP